MGWRIFYDMIFEREKERLERAIQESDDKFDIAANIAKDIFASTELITDFFVESIIEKGKNPAEDLRYMAECIARNTERGPTKNFLSPEQRAAISQRFINFEKEMSALSAYVKNFSLYIEGWTKTRLEEPLQKEIKSYDPETYALLYSMHRSVSDIDDLEYERIVEKIKKTEYGLSGIVDIVKELFDFDIDTYKKIVAPDSFSVFLRYWLASDEYEWERMLPQIENGLLVLEKFFASKFPSIEERKKTIKINCEKILSSWKNDLRDFHLEALRNCAKTKKQREKLAMKHERGIFFC